MNSSWKCGWLTRFAMVGAAMFVLAVFPPVQGAPEPGETGSVDEDGFRPLFNGRDLEGWVVVNTAPSTWRFDEDGLLICSGKPIGEIRTERMYQNFILEIEWRHMVAAGNAGIFVWADDITARGQPFHRGVEVQILDHGYGNTRNYTTHGDIFPIHGATMKPVNGRGGQRAFPTEERSLPSPQWNHYRIVCHDGTITLAVNGEVVTRGEDCVPRKGYLCLESEGGVVHYRNARILELPDTPLDEAAGHVAIADRGFRCLYTGVDFSGWETSTGSSPEAAGWEVKDWVLASGEEALPLRTSESFGDGTGWIVDFRTERRSTPVRVRAAGLELILDGSREDLAHVLEKPGRWNRVECEVSGGRATVRINDRTVVDREEIQGEPGGLISLSNQAGEGPLELLPGGPVDWANPYVRKLE